MRRNQKSFTNSEPLNKIAGIYYNVKLMTKLFNKKHDQTFK